MATGGGGTAEGYGGAADGEDGAADGHGGAGDGGGPRRVIDLDSYQLPSTNLSPERGMNDPPEEGSAQAIVPSQCSSHPHVYAIR